jgi:drug/metabolite transporter (DMT)-like permease
MSQLDQNQIFGIGCCIFAALALMMAVLGNKQLQLFKMNGVQLSTLLLVGAILCIASPMILQSE